MLSPKPNHWYAIYTRPKSKVYEQLKCSGYEVYLPLVTTIKQWSDRKKKIKTPLISSYVFIKVDHKKLNHVLGVYGVVNILKYLGKNAIVKEHEINNLKILLSNDFSFELSDNQMIKKGDEVQVVKGTLSGIKGYVIQEKNKHNLFVRLQALNRYVKAEVPLSFVEKVSKITR